MWPFKKKLPKKQVHKTATDEDISYARQVIDKAFEPVLKRNLDALNKILSDRGVRVGADITWLFEKVD